MSTKHPVVSLSEFKAKASQFLERKHASGEEIVLTQNGRATAVGHSYETHQSRKDALAWMPLSAHGDADVMAGRLTPQSQAFTDVKERLACPDG